MHYRCWCRTGGGILISLTLGIFVSGCGSKDLPKAQSAVETALEKWKKGGKPQELIDIDIAEPDWVEGNRLLDFKIMNATNQPQQGPRVIVVLNLQDSSGKIENKEIAYEVLFKDKVSIGRDAFHVGQ